MRATVSVQQNMERLHGFAVVYLRLCVPGYYLLTKIHQQLPVNKCKETCVVPWLFLFTIHRHEKQKCVIEKHTPPKDCCSKSNYLKFDQFFYRRVLTLIPPNIIIRYNTYRFYINLVKLEVV